MSTGLACEDMANDIKFNLAKQTNQMTHSVLKNLHDIQGQTTIANKVMLSIKQHRFKNKLILYFVAFFILMTIVLILYNLI